VPGVWLPALSISSMACSTRQRSRVPVLLSRRRFFRVGPKLGAVYISGKPQSCPVQECPSLCELISRGPTRCPASSKYAIRHAYSIVVLGFVVIPGDIALQPASDAPPPKVAGLLPGGASRCRRAPMSDRSRHFSTRDRPVTMLFGSGCGRRIMKSRVAVRLKAPIVHAFPGQGACHWTTLWTSA